jgi:formate hydrogenlyase subunit 6/NADH:ubiquinone oxidoreductase subunit I
MKTFKPKVPGFLVGIKIVIVNMLKTLSPFHSKPNVNYPFEKEKVAPRARGVIALDQEACTSCMLCAAAVPLIGVFILRDIKNYNLLQNLEVDKEVELF